MEQDLQKSAIDKQMTEKIDLLMTIRYNIMKNSSVKIPEQLDDHAQRAFINGYDEAIRMVSEQLSITINQLTMSKAESERRNSFELQYLRDIELFEECCSNKEV